MRYIQYQLFFQGKFSLTEYTSIHYDRKALPVEDFLNFLLMFPMLTEIGIKFAGLHSLNHFSNRKDWKSVSYY